MTKIYKDLQVKWVIEQKFRDPKYYDCFYYYSLKDKSTNKNVWERQSQRSLSILDPKTFDGSRST